MTDVYVDIHCVSHSLISVGQPDARVTFGHVTSNGHPIEGKFQQFTILTKYPKRVAESKFEHGKNGLVIGRLERHQAYVRVGDPLTGYERMEISDFRHAAALSEKNGNAPLGVVPSVLECLTFPVENLTLDLTGTCDNLLAAIDKVSAGADVFDMTGTLHALRANVECHAGMLARAQSYLNTLETLIANRV